MRIDVGNFWTLVQYKIRRKEAKNGAQVWEKQDKTLGNCEGKQ